jgi:hypothetical protein
MRTQNKEVDTVRPAGAASGLGADPPSRGWILTCELANGDTLEFHVPRVVQLRAREGHLARYRVVLTGPGGQVIGRSQFDSWRERFVASAARRGLADAASPVTPSGDDGALEYLGTYASLDDYFKNVLAEFVAEPAQWLLDLLDMHRVRERFEGDDYYYIHSPDTHAVHRAPR